MQTLGQYPQSRMRRMRRDAFSRGLMREHILTPADFIYPVFVLEGNNKVEDVKSMPGVQRKTLDLLLKDAEQCVNLGVPVMAIFPVIDAPLKSLDAREAYNPKGLVPRVVAALKKNFPELGVMTDVALDPYTTHGQDGLIDDSGYVFDDETVEVLAKQAQCHAAAGANSVVSFRYDGWTYRCSARCAENTRTNTFTPASWPTPANTLQLVRPLSAML